MNIYTIILHKNALFVKVAMGTASGFVVRYSIHSSFAKDGKPTTQE